MTLAIVVAATLAPRLVARFGARAVLTAGMLLATAGLGLLADVDAGSSYVVARPPGRAAGRGRPRHLARAGDDRRRPGSRALPERPRVGDGQHLAADRRRDRARGALTTLATSHANSEIASGTAPLVAQADGYQIAFAVGRRALPARALAAAVMLRPSRGEPLGEPVTESG